MEEKRRAELRRKEEAKDIVLESIRTKDLQENEQETMDSEDERNIPDDSDDFDKQGEVRL